MREIPHVAEGGRSEFRNLYRTADAALDTPHFSGGNTSYEAFAFGVPIVTWPGRFMRGRVTSGAYRQMGVDGCVVGSAEDYVATAVRLAHDRAWRAEIATARREQGGHLYEDGEAVREPRISSSGRWPTRSDRAGRRSREPAPMT
jgi:predicted O-linked N-acetylglucosamine transferase (SPINDLY family)